MAIEGAVSPEISHTQGAAVFRNSLFRKIKWRISYEPHADAAVHIDSIGARLVMRFDGRGEWSDKPFWATNMNDDDNPQDVTFSERKMLAVDFDINDSVNTTEVEGLPGVFEQTLDLTQLPAFPDGLPADRIEWRVYFFYKQGAWDREDWKTSLQFHGLSMELNQITRVLRHQEKR